MKNTLQPTTYKLPAKRGFTLVELLVVITILGILAGLAVTIMNPIEQIRKSSDTKRKSDLSQISKALEAYYSDHEKYPDSNNEYKIVSIAGGMSTTLEWGKAWEPYMNTLPKDSASTKRYLYYSPSSQAFYLYASLERGAKDPQVCNNGAKCTNAPDTFTCGSASDICNYGISSPNVSP